MTNAEKYKTPEEREEAFEDFCHFHRYKCSTCKLTSGNCRFEWLALDAADVDPMHCPFCKGATVIEEDYLNKPQRQVICPLCGYHSPRNIDIEEVVRVHNKFVINLEEGESK